MEAKVRSASEQIQIFDRFRKKYVKLTPEEWVRQHFAAHLTTGFMVPESRLMLESTIRYGKVAKRPDIVVIGKNNIPWLIVECKSSSVTLSTEVLQQAMTYSSVLNPRFLAITNGLDHIFYELQPELKKFVLLKELPCFE